MQQRHTSTFFVRFHGFHLCLRVQHSSDVQFINFFFSVSIFSLLLFFVVMVVVVVFASYRARRLIRAPGLDKGMARHRQASKQPASECKRKMNFLFHYIRLWSWITLPVTPAMMLFLQQ